MIRQYIRQILQESLKLSSRDTSFLLKRVNILQSWFEGEWMDLQEIDKEVIRYMKVFAKLTPRPNKQRLYRVIGIKKAHECKEYKKLSNVLMETSNKKMQSWTTSIESAKQFYSDIYRSLSDRMVNCRG
jgi:hypothetical protein